VRLRYKKFSVSDDWEYVSSRAVSHLVDDTCGMIAIDIDTGHRVAAAIFDHLFKGSAQVHVMIDNPRVLRHGFLEAAADFVFNFLDKQVCFGLTPASNLKAMRFNTRVCGFTEAYRIPNGYAPGKDLVLMQLLKEDCIQLSRTSEDV
jgi:hypothetical protein